jgi:hypothetical protein
MVYVHICICSYINTYIHIPFVCGAQQYTKKANFKGEKNGIQYKIVSPNVSKTPKNPYTTVKNKRKYISIRIDICVSKYQHICAYMNRKNEIQYRIVSPNVSKTHKNPYTTVKNKRNDMNKYEYLYE